jgi:hypothetical protein
VTELFALADSFIFADWFPTLPSPVGDAPQTSSFAATPFDICGRTARDPHCVLHDDAAISGGTPIIAPLLAATLPDQRPHLVNRPHIATIAGCRPFHTIIAPRSAATDGEGEDGNRRMNVEFYVMSLPISTFRAKVYVDQKLLSFTPRVPGVCVFKRRCKRRGSPDIVGFG